jgi:HAMP domain-containing protein
VVAQRNGIAVAEAVSRYGVVITDLVSYGDAVSQYAGDGEVADGLRALAAFAKAKAGSAEQEAIAYAARVTRDNSDEQRTAFIATQTSQQEALTAFSLVASPAQQNLVNSVVTGDAVNLAGQVSTEIRRGEEVAPADVTSSLGAVVDLMRWAEQQLESSILKKAADERDSVVRQTAVEAVLVLLVLAVAIALAVVLARSLNLSLRRLREGALSVAHRDLPEVVARLRDSRNLAENSAEEIVEQVKDPIRLNNRDEIGQVAQAFNVVHKEAVRIAAEQAALRTSVSTMFLNLARRSQSLVDRMIGELDTIERTEEDPKRLARLFELDHLATRMRRNDENLLVLAGADSSAPRREDALLVDALRASQSEVELYNRIEFGTVDTDVSIVALAVNDVVRLVAELLDNATRFSPPNTYTSPSPVAMRCAASAMVCKPEEQ